MAYCEILTSRKVSEDTEILLNRYVARIIQLVIGEGEESVKLTISGNQPMSFEGSSDEAFALVQIKDSVELTTAQSELMKKEFYPVVAKFLNLSQDKVRVVYQQIAAPF